MVNAGNYKGKGIKGSAQLGETNNGNLQIGIDVECFDADKKSVGSMTTFLYFSPDAGPYSFERLALLGWKGKGPQDIDEKMDGIDANEVDVRVTVAESYKASDGTTKSGASKLEIVTGGGRVTFAKPLDANTFKARLSALSGGGTAPSGGAAPSSGGTAPPF